MINRKIVLLVCMLLISAITIPLANAFDYEKQTLIPQVTDQEQPNAGEIHWLLPSTDNWQQFVNQGNMIEVVQLHFGCYYSGSADVTLSIEETIGTSLTQVTYPASAFPPNVQDWFKFDVPDVKLERGKTYHIVIRFDPGSEYGWSGEHGDPYNIGGSSHPDADWDYAFRTIVDKSKPYNINQLFLKFLENHSHMFPILRHIIGL